MHIVSTLSSESKTRPHYQSVGIGSELQHNIKFASLWTDYVPSESNPADVPSRYHEMSDEEIRNMTNVFGPFIQSVVPTFTDQHGNWLSSIEIARQVWG